jgi:hypothetical protein
MINKDTAVLYYMKYPNTPAYDYYRDVNGNYVYLAEGEVHVWATGEKDSSGNTKTIGDSDYTSLTIELEWKEQDKLEIASRILKALGVNLDRKGVSAYAQQLKNEQ